MQVPLTPFSITGTLSSQDVNGWTLLAAVAVLAPVCFWVYNDAQMRYNGRGTPLLWSLLVFFALIIFLPLYLMIRPPKRRSVDSGRPPGGDR